MLRRRLGITKPNGKIFIVIYFSVLYQLESFANIIFNYLFIVLWCRRYYLFHKFITFAIHNFLLVQTKFYFLPLLLLSLFPFSQKTPSEYPCMLLSNLALFTLFAAQRQYSLFISIPQYARPNFFATTAAVPLPRKGSKILSPGFDEASTSLAYNFSGF